MKHLERLSASALIALSLLSFPSYRAVAQAPGGNPQVLTIEQAVSIAVERNLSINLAQSRVESAGVHVTSSFGSFLPRITFSGGYNKPLTDGTSFVNGIPIVGSQPDYTLQANATASLLLFDGFSRTANYNAAQSSFNASVQTLNRTRQDIAFQTRSAFLEALRTEQIIEVRRNDLELAREQLARTKGLVEAGAAQIGTVYSQESEVANAELAQELARTDAIIARNRLSLLLNMDPATRLQVSAEGLMQSVDSAEVSRARGQFGSTADLFQRQLAGRPDILAAKLQVDVAAASVTAAKAGYYPQVSTSIGWGWQKSAQSGSTQTVGSLTSNSAQLGLNLEYTAFDGFHTGEQVQLAEAQRQSAEIDLRRLELQARSELEQALARLEGSERQLHYAEKAVVAARQNRYAANERYKLGAGGYADYLLANSQYLTAQINQVNAVFQYRLALYEIRYLIGE